MLKNAARYIIRTILAFAIIIVKQMLRKKYQVSLHYVSSQLADFKSSNLKHAHNGNLLHHQKRCW